MHHADNSLLISFLAVVGLALLTSIESVPTALLVATGVIPACTALGRAIGWAIDLVFDLPDRFAVRRVASWEQALGLVGVAAGFVVSLVVVVLATVG